VANFPYIDSTPLCVVQFKRHLDARLSAVRQLLVERRQLTMSPFPSTAGFGAAKCTEMKDVIIDKGRHVGI